MFKLTDEQKQDILNKLIEIDKNNDKQTEIYKQNSIYLTDTEYTKEYIRLQEESKRQNKELIQKLKNGEEIPEDMLLGVMCLLTTFDNTFDSDTTEDNKSN